MGWWNDYLMKEHIIKLTINQFPKLTPIMKWPNNSMVQWQNYPVDEMTSQQNDW
jgi:hypothetical protein